MIRTLLFVASVALSTAIAPMLHAQVHNYKPVTQEDLYAVNGKQYVAVMTGDSLLTQGLVRQVAPEIKTEPGHNAIYVFAVPGQ